MIRQSFGDLIIGQLTDQLLTYGGFHDHGIADLAMGK